MSVLLVLVCGWETGCTWSWPWLSSCSLAVSSCYRGVSRAYGSGVWSASDEVICYCVLIGCPLYFDNDSTHRAGRIYFLLLTTSKPFCSSRSLHVVGEFLMLSPRLGCEMTFLTVFFDWNLEIFILESMLSYVLKLCNVVVIWLLFSIILIFDSRLSKEVTSISYVRFSFLLICRILTLPRPIADGFCIW